MACRKIAYFEKALSREQKKQMKIQLDYRNSRFFLYKQSRKLRPNIGTVKSPESVIIYVNVNIILCDVGLKKFNKYTM